MSLQAAVAPSYESLQQLWQDSGRLGRMEGPEFQEDLRVINRQIEDILKQVQREPIDAEAVPAAEALLNAAGGTRTEQAIAQAFEEAGYQLDTQTIQQIQAVFRAAAELPTEYFEAKPERAVGFDEVLAAVVPNDSSRALLVGLEQAGVQTLKYRAGDDADRLEKVNSVESARFSMKSGQGSDQILQKMLESIDEIIVLEDAGEITPDQARERAEIATHTAMESLSKLYGRIQPGERPAARFSGTTQECR